MFSTRIADDALRRYKCADEARHRRARLEVAVELMATDRVLVKSRLTEVEMRRNVSLLLRGDDLVSIRRQLQADLDAFALVSLDATTCSDAARIAEETLCRSLDSLHLAAARRAGEHTTLLTSTFDRRRPLVPSG